MTDNIIQFPGTKRVGVDKAAPGTDETQAAVHEKGKAYPLTDEQRKAIEVILSCQSYICIGLKDTETGADIYSSIGGDKTTLRNAQFELQGIIDRAYQRAGIV